MSDTKKMEEIFKPESQTILKLFNNTDSHYQIPDYQRPYSWTDEQVEQLWEDLTDAFENNQHDPEADKNYFLGSIITVPADRGYHDVIDGQQRLTTLMIMFCVIRDLFPELNKEIDANQVPDVIKLRKLRNCISDEDERKRLKLCTHPTHQNDFETLILDANTTNIKKPSQKEIKNHPKNKFLNTASIFLEKFKGLPENSIGNFINYIFNSVKIIKISCTNKQFAIKLFQSLNATGLDLTPTDLLKSFFMSKIPDGKSAQFISDWTYIDSLMRDTEIKDLNELFVIYQYYVLAANPKRSLNEELEDKFRTVDPNKAIVDIKIFAETLKKIIYDDDNKTVFSLHYLRWPLYWKAIVAGAQKEKYEHIDELIIEIRRFYYLYWIAGKTLTQIKQTSFNLIKWVKEHESIDQIRNNLEEKIQSDGIIEQALSNLRGSAYNEPWLKPLLISIEYEQTDDSTYSFIEMSANLHVEHIIPVESAKFEEWAHITPEIHSRYINSIANLTLLSGSKNIEASNNPFEEKVKVYKGLGKYGNKKNGLTAFKITQRIVDEAREPYQWTELDAIKRWNWLSGEISTLLRIDTTSIKLS